MLCMCWRRARGQELSPACSKQSGCPGDPTRELGPKIPRTFAAAVQPAAPSHLPVIFLRTRSPLLSHRQRVIHHRATKLTVFHLLQTNWVPPPEQEPPRDATLVITASDKPVEPSVTLDPPAPDKPVEQHLPASTFTGPTESNMETATEG